MGGVEEPPRRCLLLLPWTLPGSPLVATDGAEELRDLGRGRAEGRAKAACRADIGSAAGSEVGPSNQVTSLLEQKRKSILVMNF